MPTIIKKAMNQINPPNKKKDFMKGLGDWASSPGGIVTLIGFGLIAAYLIKNHK